MFQLKVDRIYKAVFALIKQGAGAAAPAKRNDVILRSARRRMATKDLVPPHLQGRRGACTVKFDVNNRKTKFKPLC